MGSVAKMIQVRNVPDRLHRELTRRARKRGQTLTAFVQELLEMATASPPDDEVFARIRSRRPVRSEVSNPEMIRTERSEREARWSKS
jgi:plasmid stability protein